MRPIPPLLASGDPVLFLLLGGVLLLATIAIGLGIAGGVILFRSKSDEQKKTGRRFIAAAAIPVLIATVWWIAVVGFD